MCCNYPEYHTLHLEGRLHRTGQPPEELLFCAMGQLKSYSLLNISVLLLFLCSSPDHQGPYWDLRSVSGARIPHSAPLWCWGLTHTQYHLVKGQPAHCVQSPADVHPGWTGAATGLSSGRKHWPLHLQGHKSSRHRHQTLFSECAG